MPTVLKRVSVPGNSSVDVMTDTAYEYPPAPTGNIITVAAVAAATGMQLDVNLGQRNAAEDLDLTLAAANVNPVIPDNVVVRDAAMPGERIRVNLVNTTGAAIVGAVLVDIG